MSVIEINKLTKTYRNGKGIFNINFNIEEGEVFGYLGPNGAGKTTTIRHLMGFTNANEGSCKILGLDCREEREKIQGLVGYLPGEIAFFDNMTGKEFLLFMNSMRKVNSNTRMDNLIEMLELDIERKIKKMSKGMKQKLGIVTAFMHDPKVYILDEPTSGLDPLMQKKFINLVNEEKNRGKTILMSSHSFEEVDKTSDRVGVIKEGKLVAVEDIHSIKASQRKVFLVKVEGNKDIKTITESDLEIGHIHNNEIEIILSSNYNEFNNVLAKCNVLGISILNQSLEEVFMKYYGEDSEINE